MDLTGLRRQEHEQIYPQLTGPLRTVSMAHSALCTSLQYNNWCQRNNKMIKAFLWSHIIWREWLVFSHHLVQLTAQNYISAIILTSSKTFTQWMLFLNPFVSISLSTKITGRVLGICIIWLQSIHSWDVWQEVLNWTKPRDWSALTIPA